MIAPLPKSLLRPNHFATYAQYVTGHEFAVDQIWADLVIMRHLSEEHEN